jgi:hypothetical protein
MATNQNGVAVAVAGVAKWDGTSWSALGTGVSGSFDVYVYSLAVSGSDVYAGGHFTGAGGTPVNYIAKWNGSAWSAMGAGVQEPFGNSYQGVYALAPAGGDLYVGGLFTLAGGRASTYLARLSIQDPPLVLSNSSTANGVFGFTVLSASGQAMTVEYSATLASNSWAALLTTNSPGGQVRITDPATNSHRFYRARKGF